MSDKRFVLEYDSNCYKCIFDNEQKELYSSRESICDLLNQLNDENEQLKSLIDACEYGQKSLMKEMKHNDETLDKIWKIMKELYGVSDDE